MRMLMIPAIAVTMAVSPLALAQSQQGSPQQEQAASPQDSTSQQSASQQSGARAFSEIRSSLEQAGVQNVQVLDASYVVRAQSEDGQQVTMLVDPPMTPAAMGATGAQTGQGQQQSSAQSQTPDQTRNRQEQVRQALTEAGFSNIQIVEASYLAMGQTSQGDQVTMMIDSSASQPGGQGQSATSPSATGSPGTTSPGASSD